jgi:lysyl-tRNA synthetase, class II
MRPEVKTRQDDPAAFAAIGVPEEWVPVLNKMGHVTVDALKNLSAGKLFNDLCGYNKKNKLGLPNPSMEDVKKWVEGK